MRRFAEDTSVPVGRSRAEIDRLLQDWGCGQLQWSDDYKSGRVRLRFLWEHNGKGYLARFDVKLPARTDLEKHAIDGRTGKVSENKLQALMDARGKAEHRTLLLWLKACLNAVESGIVTAEMIFLPFLEGKDGQTVGEIAIPKLADLAGGSASRLLGEGK